MTSRSGACCVALSAAISIAAAAVGARADDAAHAEPTFALDVESGPLLLCLERIALAARVRIIDTTARAADARCTAQHGAATLAQALDRALAPAGLSWRRASDGTIEIVVPAPVAAAPAAPAPRATPVPRTRDVHLDPLEVQGDRFDNARPPLPAVSAFAERAQALTRLDERWLDTAPLLGFDQIGRYAPNLYGTGESLAIRGIERDTDFVASFSVTFDGIDLGTRLLDDELVPLDAVTRLDLARGPRAFESGAGAAAGSIRLATAAPTTALSSQTSASAGTDGALRLSSAISGPIGTTGLSGTLALSHRELPDYIDQRVVPEAGRDVRENDSARLKLAFAPEWLDGLELEAAALMLAGDSSDRWIEEPAPGTAAAVTFDPFGRDSYAAAPVDSRTRARGGSASARYTAPRWGVDIRGAATAIERDGVVLPARATKQPESEDRRRSGIDFHVTPFDGARIVLGADRADLAVSSSNIFTRPVVSPRPPSSGVRIEPASDVVTNETTRFDTRTESGFLWLEYGWRETLTAGVGVRWLSERAYTNRLFEQHITDPQCREVFPAGQSRPCSEFVPTGSSELPNVVDTRLPIPLAAIEWRPWADHAFSVSHGRGFRSGGTTRLGSEYLAEREESTELSWRARWWDRRVSTALTVFDGHVRDRFVFPIDGSFDLNTGSAHIRGVELEAEAELGERWRARGGLGLLDARYVEFRDLGGERTGGAPPHTVDFGVRYGASAGWYGAADFFHAGPAQTNPLSSRAVRRPAYSLLDARVGYRTTHWDAALVGTNVTDEDYIVRVDNTPTPSGATPIRYRLGDPRHVELRLEWRW